MIAALYRRVAACCLMLLAVAGCAESGNCDLIRVAQVPLQPKSRLFAIPVTLNGRTASMLLDTGSQKSVLSEDATQRLGIVRDARFYTAMVGMSGGSASPDATIDRMSIGEVALPVDRLPVTTFSGSIGIDGVLGLDLLRDYDLDIDGPQRSLTLYKVRHCEKAEPPWAEPAAMIAVSTTQMGWLQVPFEINQVKGVAFIDTGASYSMVMPRMARRLGLTEETMAGDRTLNLHVMAGEDAKTRVHRFAVVTIGPLTARNVSLLVLTREPPSIGDARHFGDGVIGQDFLSRRRIWFSFRTGRLYVSRRDGDSGN